MGADMDAAKKAVDEKNGEEFNGKPMFVGRAQKKSERMAELKDKFDKIKLERINKYQGVNLYVKNLDEGLDDETFQREFAEHGTITSCKIMRDDKGAAKGFGFVCYTTAEEATKAATEMNGKIIASKPIYVALAQRKEQRRQQLQNQMEQRAAVSHAECRSWRHARHVPSSGSSCLLPHAGWWPRWQHGLLPAPDGWPDGWPASLPTTARCQGWTARLPRQSSRVHGAEPRWCSPPEPSRSPGWQGPARSSARPEGWQGRPRPEGWWSWPPVPAGCSPGTCTGTCSSCSTSCSCPAAHCFGRLRCPARRCAC